MEQEDKNYRGQHHVNNFDTVLGIKNLENGSIFRCQNSYSQFGLTAARLHHLGLDKAEGASSNVEISDHFSRVAVLGWIFIDLEDGETVEFSILRWQSKKSGTNRLRCSFASPLSPGLQVR